MPHLITHTHPVTATMPSLALPPPGRSRAGAHSARAAGHAVPESGARAATEAADCLHAVFRPPSQRPLAPLVEAVSIFAQRAAEKLRAQDHRAGAVHVFTHTSPFRDGPRFARSATIQLPQPSSDTALLVRTAARGIAKIYEPGYQLSKAGVMLLDLFPVAVQQASLLDELNDYASDHSPLMEAMDRLNERYGKGTVMASTL